MAQRSVFYVGKDNAVHKQTINLKWAWDVNKDIAKVHNAFQAKHPKAKMLEISSASKSYFGKNSSAMKLHVKTSHGVYTAEQLYQSGKVYQNLSNGKKFSMQSTVNLPSKQAKKLAKKKLKGHKNKLVGFQMFGNKFPLQPTTYFYDWTYLHGLQQHPKLLKSMTKHNAFTDVYSNPQYTKNTQAKSCALFKSIYNKYGMEKFNELMRDPTAFEGIDAQANHDPLSKKIQAQVWGEKPNQTQDEHQQLDEKTQKARPLTMAKPKHKGPDSDSGDPGDAGAAGAAGYHRGGGPSAAPAANTVQKQKPVQQNLLKPHAKPKVVQPKTKQPKVDPQPIIDDLATTNNRHVQDVLTENGIHDRQKYVKDYSTIINHGYANDPVANHNLKMAKTWSNDKYVQENDHGHIHRLTSKDALNISKQADKYLNTNPHVDMKQFMANKARADHQSAMERTQEVQQTKATRAHIQQTNQQIAQTRQQQRTTTVQHQGPSHSGPNLSR